VWAAAGGQQDVLKLAQDHGYRGEGDIDHDPELLICCALAAWGVHWRC